MTRRATIRTAHADPETIAAAIAPDNTDEMETCVERAGDEAGRRIVVTTIERDSTSGLQSTVDDTLINLAVADEMASHARSTDVATSGADSATDDDATEPIPSDVSTDDTADASQRTKDTTNTTHE